MKYIITFGAFTVAVLTQTFEPADFNVAEALFDNGVDVSAIPVLAPYLEGSLDAGCSAACDALKSIFGAAYVELQSDSAYNAFVNNYWSAQQREIAPQCVFKPTKALDVSTLILISRLTQCPFAAKSGGHSAVPGGSNVDGGITISFEKLDKIELSSDKKIVSFQPGHVWSDIYSALEKDNVTIIGGRVASVGVGGLTLGGGISYFSSIYGLACDNVKSYELVTALGGIINVDEKSYSDLYWALRGGGNNFGIVTQFNVAAIPRASTISYLSPEFPALFQAYYNLGMNAKKDGKAHQILNFGWGGPAIGLAASVELEYANPIANASILAEYNAIKGAISDRTAIRSLTQLTQLSNGTASRAGLRQSFWTFTVKLDKELPMTIKDVFVEELSAVLDVEGIIPSLSFQVFTEPMLEKMAARGGNALGLSVEDGPLTNVLVAAKWTQSADDERINKFQANVKDRAMALAAAQGKAHPYLYMNYASPWQDAVAGYGAANQERLKAISKKYDPTGVFQKLQPGYFKLDGPPRSKV